MTMADDEAKKTEQQISEPKQDVDNEILAKSGLGPLKPETWVAIVIGLGILLFAIIGRSYFRIAPSTHDLLIATGLAITFTAFGAQGVFRNKSIALAGAAAIALIFWTYQFGMDRYRHKDAMQALEKSSKAYFYGNIKDLPEGKYGVEIGLLNPISTRRPPNSKNVEFIGLGSELRDSASASIRVFGKKDSKLDVSFVVPRECIYGALVHSTPLLWKFKQLDEERAELSEDNSGNVIARSDIQTTDTANLTCTNAETYVAQREISPTSWISAAFAAEIEKINLSDIDQALLDIQSTDGEVSRSARNILSRAEPEDVGYILGKVRTKLQVDPDIYRTKLRVSLALTEMLRRDKSVRDRITMTDADIQMLLDFAGEDERSLRIYAGEFLYDLERPAVTKLALPKALKPPRDDALYNWILVSQGGWQKMTAPEKQNLGPTLGELRKLTSRVGYEKTAELLSKFD